MRGGVPGYGQRWEGEDVYLSSDQRLFHRRPSVALDEVSTGLESLRG